MDFSGADPFELAHERGGVVVGHDVVWPDGEEASGAQGALGAFGEMGLGEFFSDGLGHGQPLSGEGKMPSRQPARRRRYFSWRFFCCVLALGVGLGDALLARTSVFISAISLVTDPRFSRFQMASLSFFWALVERT